jgi:multisubunit Na+/H+ antiporter MnhG subunit
MVMTFGHVVVAILLGLTVLTCWLCALGILIMHGAFDKLHYLSPASLIGGFFLLIAMLVEKGLSADMGKVLLIVVLLWVSNPILTYASARATMTRKSRRTNEQPEREA